MPIRFTSVDAQPSHIDATRMKDQIAYRRLVAASCHAMALLVEGALLLYPSSL
jgi:hypothetical protein